MAAARGALEAHQRPVLGGIYLLIAVVLAPVLGFGWVSDDGWTLTANGFLRCPEDLGLLLSETAALRHVPDAFRPTLVAFDVLTYQLLGLAAPAHHALSLALHVGVCALAERWLATLAAPFALRAATVTLFGLLAIHAEAIAVVSFREDLLAAALGLGALVTASAALRQRRRGAAITRAVAAAILLALACGAKMSAAALPALWWLAETLDPWGAPRPREEAAEETTTPRRRTRRRLAITAALGLGVAAALAHTLVIFGALSPYAGADNLRLYASRLGLGPVLAMSTQIHLGYLQQMIVPWGLSPEYVDRGASWGEPATILASAALLSLVCYGLWASSRRRRPVVALAILGAFALALPTSNLVAMPNMRADRLMYLPSLPVALGLAALGLALGRALTRALTRHLIHDKEGHGSWAPAITAAPLALLAIVQGTALLAEIQVYRSPSALWSAALRRAPGSARAQAIYGELLLANRDPDAAGSPGDRGLLARARAACRRALELDPLDELSHLCAARLAIAEERWPAADHHLRRALGLSVDRNHRTLAALAEITLDLPGRPEAVRRREALEIAARGIREYPYAVEVWAAAGRILHRTGDPWAAERALQRAHRLAPERPQSVLLAIEAALDRGDRERAQRLLDDHADLLDEAAPAAAALERRLWDHVELFPPPRSFFQDSRQPPRQAQGQAW